MTGGVPRLCITGTPGTGKTSLSARAEGMSVISVRELASLRGHLGDVDPNDGAAEVDVDALGANLLQNPSGHDMIEGHLSHHLPCEALVILRCQPSVLEQRLSTRGWSGAKVRENVEWEFMGGPWMDLHGQEDLPPILELDSSNSTTEELWASLQVWLAGGPSGAESAPPLDWMELE